LTTKVWLKLEAKYKRLQGLDCVLHVKVFPWVPPGRKDWQPCQRITKLLSQLPMTGSDATSEMALFLCTKTQEI